MKTAILTVWENGFTMLTCGSSATSERQVAGYVGLTTKALEPVQKN